FSEQLKKLNSQRSACNVFTWCELTLTASILDKIFYARRALWTFHTAWARCCRPQTKSFASRKFDAVGTRVTSRPPVAIEATADQIFLILEPFHPLTHLRH